MSSSIQLTLFVDKNDSSFIELIRKKYNPLQYQLINSHVTLCREDELLDTNTILETLKNLTYSCFILQFGKPTRFADGKGLLLPEAGSSESFHALRKIILTGASGDIKIQQPHITLMHPRNSTCTDEIFEEIKKIETPSQLMFKKISLIEQESNSQWKVLKEFNLR